MAIQVTCGRCGAKLTVQESLVGQRAKCTNCGNEFVLLAPQSIGFRTGRAVAKKFVKFFKRKRNILILAGIALFFASLFGILAYKSSRIKQAAREKSEGEIWVTKGYNFEFTFEKYPEALQAYEKAVALDPDNAIYWNAKGDLLSKLARYEEAAETYDRAVSICEKEILKGMDRGVEIRPFIVPDTVEELSKIDTRYKKSDRPLSAFGFPTIIDMYEMHSGKSAYGYNEFYPLVYYKKARALAKAGKKEQMLKCLKPHPGLKRLIELAQKDQDFKEYWNDPDFKAIVE